VHSAASEATKLIAEERAPHFAHQRTARHSLIGYRPEAKRKRSLISSKLNGRCAGNAHLLAQRSRFTHPDEALESGPLSLSTVGRLAVAGDGDAKREQFNEHR
jgi:hypothetical protein